jgi:nucleoid-associated protein YgaU
LIREGSEKESLPLFLHVIAKNPSATNSHLHAGRIYLTKCDDPVYAIYHFREYLSLEKSAKETAVVKQLVDTAKKNFVRSLPGHGSDLSMHTELLEIARRLREENVALKRALREVQKRCQSLEFRREDGEIHPPVGGKTRHTVRVGDTLSKISQKYYGTPVHWRKIFEANRDEIPFPNALTVGQELLIP